MGLNLFRDFLPSFPQTIDGAVNESRADLEHSVVIVHATADVGNGRPFLYADDSLRYRLPSNDFRYDEATGLYKGQQSRRLIIFTLSHS